jgi:hypothetical protein
MNQPESQQPRDRAISGKLVILSILAVALVAAGTSWVFRYYTTHQAADFWGPTGSRLIRDAPRVSLSRIYLGSAPTTRDISKAPGITHLRNALLEDRSFGWRQTFDAAPKHFSWQLSFSDPAGGQQLTILFTSNCNGAMLSGTGRTQRTVSTEPISKGLCEVFTEYLPDAAPR